jgi:hypothetical protein
MTNKLHDNESKVIIWGCHFAWILSEMWEALANKIGKRQRTQWIKEKYKEQFKFSIKTKEDIKEFEIILRQNYYKDKTDWLREKIREDFHVTMPDYFYEMLHEYKGKKADELPKKIFPTSYFKEPMYNEDKMDLAELVKEFKKKYVDNEKFKEYTDMDYYETMEGVTINFDKCNKDNFPPYMLSHVFLDFTDGLKAVTEDGKSKTSLFNQFIWRPDVEQEMVNLINKRRKEKGLNPVEIDPNLHAISKWSCKRDFFGYTSSTFTNRTCFTRCEVPYRELYSKDCDSRPVNILRSGYSNWILGKTSLPFAHDMNQVKDFEGTYFEYEYQRKKDMFVDLTENLENLFGYEQETKLVNGSFIVYDNAEDILNYWESKEILKSGQQETIGVVNEPFAEIDIEKTLYDPDIKTIGVGSVYFRPLYNGSLNGLTGIYVMVSK